MAGSENETVRRIYSSVRSGVAEIGRFCGEFSQFLTSRTAELKSGSELVRTQDALRRLAGDVAVRKARFVRSPDKKAHSECTVNLNRIIKSVRQAERILEAYQKKITRLEAEWNEALALLESAQGDAKERAARRAAALVSQHVTAVEFSIFLAFKLFKLELLEYFLYIRDQVDYDHEIWEVLNFREVYSALFDLVSYFEYCASMVSAAKKSSSEETRELFEAFGERSAVFATARERLGALCAQIKARKLKRTGVEEALRKKLVESQGAEKTTAILSKSRELSRSLLYPIFKQQPMYETLVRLVTCLHLRYLNLIEKFVLENKGAQFLEANLLPVCGNSQDKEVTKKYSLNNKFETLVRLIRTKVVSNLKKLEKVQSDLDSKFQEADVRVLAAERFAVLRTLPEIAFKSHRILSDSHEYITLLIPLFPIPADSVKLAAPPRMPVTAFGIKKNGPKRQKTGEKSSSGSSTPSDSVFRGSLTTQAFFPRRNGRHGPYPGLYMRNHVSHQQHARQQHAYHAQYCKEYGEQSFLSTSWFISYGLKRRYDEMVLCGFVKLAKFLNEVRVEEWEEGVLSERLETFKKLMKELDSMYEGVLEGEVVDFLGYGEKREVKQGQGNRSP